MKRNEDIEYDPKLAIIRISIFLLIIILSYMVVSTVIKDKKQEEKFLQFQNINANETYSELIYLQNSKGNFFSLKNNVYVEGQNNTNIKRR